MSSETISTFGFGSLVNLDTLAAPPLRVVKARVFGYRRIWLRRPALPLGSYAPVADLAFLSVHPVADGAIDGLVIEEPADALEQLTKREALYDRVAIPHEAIAAETAIRTPSLYIAQEVEPLGDPPPSILKSYLDAVAQGYLTHFGEQGLRQFVETTDNFHLPVLDDTEAPLYPRSVRLSPGERALIDRTINEMLNK